MRIRSGSSGSFRGAAIAIISIAVAVEALLPAFGVGVGSGWQ
jgi:hypothetical protein